MKLSELPWGMIKKVAGAALVASGLVGTGYMAANTAPTTCQEINLTVPLKVYLDGKEIKPSKEKP